MTPAKRKMLNISALVVIAATLLGSAVAAGKAIMHARGGMGQVQGNTDLLGVHEEKIHAIEAIVIETHTIVTRIDKRMEREPR